MGILPANRLDVKFTSPLFFVGASSNRQYEAKGTLVGIAEKIGDDLTDAVGVCVGRRQCGGVWPVLFLCSQERKENDIADRGLVGE
jgi:hypothetical protein